MPENYRSIQEGISSYVQIGAVIFLILAGLFIGFILLSVQKRKRLEVEKQQLQSQFQQELLKTQLEIQEETLKKISEEIHDNIGQALSLAKLNLNTMDITKQKELEQKILNSKELVSKAINDLRDLSRSFNTDNIAAIGLSRAIEYELEMVQKSGSHKTTTIVNGTTARLEPQKELILFRIAQEVFQNIIKHANANTITVQIDYSGGQVELKIADDGKGFDLTPLNDEKNTFGLGIRNMHNRAKLIGGRFHMQSSPGLGTRVSIAVPLNNNHQS